MSIDLSTQASYTTPVHEEVGKCHICERSAPIRYCGMCEHWFCQSCRKAFFWRGLAAVKEKISGKQPGCCGPKEEANAGV